MHSRLQAAASRRLMQRIGQQQRITPILAMHSASSSPLLSLSAAPASAISSSSSSAPLAAAARSFTSTTAAQAGTTTASPSGSSEGEEGRQSAPVGEDAAEGQQGQLSAEEELKSYGYRPRPPILDVDPYPPEKLAALEEKYKWVDFNAMAHHLHMSDVHFFDQEVPYIDQDFTIKPDFRLLHRLEGANRLKRLQEHEDKKIDRLLDFGYWVTSGRNVRVATEGKIQSVWTMLVAGDQNGTASFGFGKADDMVLAEQRALQDLRRNMLFVPMFESRTLSHEITGRHGVCQVRMWPRPREAGMTGGMIARMIFECFGIRDVTAKVVGRALPHHQALAIFNGLREVKNLREEAMRRGVTAHRMFERGVQQPRHPGRAELYRRGHEVTSLLREVRAMQMQDQLLESTGQKPKGSSVWAEPQVDPKKFLNPNRDNTYVSGYIVRKPEPVDMGAHYPAPNFPNSKRAPIKETLNKSRGLPHPKTPQTMPHTKMA